MRTLQAIIHEKRSRGRNCTKSSTATGCGVLPAGTVAKFQTASLGFARFATTGLDPSLCPGATSEASNIEKKPFFDAHPGALAHSFGMLGQNWVTSQALRDPGAAVVGPVRQQITARPFVPRMHPIRFGGAELPGSHAISSRGEDT
jgi:hypothetical protein